MYQFKINEPHFLPHLGCELEICLKQGFATVITGDNGIGKTTLLKYLFERNREVATLVEQNALDSFYDRSLAQLQRIFLAASQGQIDEAFFLKCWNTLGLTSKSERYQSALSGGEGQALKLALGLAFKGPMLFLDEPSQYLDASAKELLGSLIGEVLKAGKLVCMIEHDLGWTSFPIERKDLEIRGDYLREKNNWNI